MSFQLKALSRSSSDAVFSATWGLIALFGASLALTIFVFVFAEAIPFLSHVGLFRLFTDGSWYPSQGLYGTTAIIFGSLAISFGALIIAAPLSIATAIYCEFYAGGTTKKSILWMLKVLAGVPSVVFGLWGLINVVPYLAAIRAPGQSLLAGSLVLAMMLVPTISLFAYEALAAVPRAYLYGAAAIALPRWKMIRMVVLPAARSGIMAGVLLALGRALGETMAVLMVCGNVIQMPGSIFDPVRPFTAHIALEMAYATGDHRSALFACGAVLIAIEAAIAIAADRVRKGVALAR
jgi:phosphate transport system permease protein